MTAPNARLDPTLRFRVQGQGFGEAVERSEPWVFFVDKRVRYATMMTQESDLQEQTLSPQHQTLNSKLLNPEP